MRFDARCWREGFSIFWDSDFKTHECRNLEFIDFFAVLKILGAFFHDVCVCVWFHQEGIKLIYDSDRKESRNFRCLRLEYRDRLF